MRKKDFKGRVEKRVLSKCEGVCRTYDKLQYEYATLLNESDDVKTFMANVLMEGLELGDYVSDFVITKNDGGLMVRECVFRDKLTKPMPSKYEYI